MIELIKTIFDPQALLVEGLYNLSFEIIATWITYKYLFKPMIIKQVKKELQNVHND